MLLCTHWKLEAQEPGHAVYKQETEALGPSHLFIDEERGTWGLGDGDPTHRQGD